VAELVEAGTQGGVPCGVLGADAQIAEWPVDSKVRDAVLDGPMYRQLTRSRLRLLLEALEDRLRDMAEEPCPRNLTIEHVMPQHRDEEEWPLPGNGDPEAEARRENLVHTLGNLTLLTNKLNPSLSNSAWPEKRKGLGEHSVLQLKQSLISQEEWDEDAILERGAYLADLICEIWPRPG